MKTKSFSVAVAMVAFATMLLGSACSPGANTGSQNQNHSQNVNQTEQKSAALIESACNDPDFVEKAKKVKGRILEKMGNDLKKQYLGDPAQNLQPIFTYEVRKSPNGDYLEAYFQGEIRGDDGLKELSDIVNDFQEDSKGKGCLRKVYFVPEGPLPLTRDDWDKFFMWSACEHPLQACSDGLCDNPCPGETPPVGNTNSSSNSNAANTNAANTNRENRNN